MLEDGRAPKALASTPATWLASRGLARAARIWGACVRVPRPLRLPAGVEVVCVGGATLGGSGKTPLALAYAIELSRERDVDVVIVGHAYASRPGVARFVAPTDDVRVVGDEALACTRALATRASDVVGVGARVRVVVAPKRQAAIDFAAAHARVLVLDGVAQTSPVRATRALLALDAHAPWGSDALPPLGDLRAPHAALFDACDEIFLLRDVLDPSPSARLRARIRSLTPKPIHVVPVFSRGALLRGELVSWRELSGARIGLVTALARPARVIAWLARRGITPRIVQSGCDHRAPQSAAEAPHAPEVDLWLTTSKCATHLTDERQMRAGAPVAVIEHEVGLTGQARGNTLEKPGPRRTRPSSLAPDRPTIRTAGGHCDSRDDRSDA